MYRSCHQWEGWSHFRLLLLLPGTLDLSCQGLLDHLPLHHYQLLLLLRLLLLLLLLLLPQLLLH
jgi:hypothetical protein